MLRTVIIEGGYANECPPIQIAGENIQQLIRGLEHNYPSFINKFYQTPWSIEVRNSKTQEQFAYNEVMLSNQLELGSFDEVKFIPNPDGGFFLAPLLLAAMSSLGGAVGAAATAAGVAGTAAAAGGSAFALGAATAGGLAGVMGTVAAIGSAVIVMGAMYGLQQLFQPSQPKINDPSAASGGDHGSFLYNSPPNVTEQGHPIPIVYGQCRTGGTVISAELATVKYVKIKSKWVSV